jgi:hypothetical protein
VNPMFCSNESNPLHFAVLHSRWLWFRDLLRFSIDSAFVVLDQFDRFDFSPTYFWSESTRELSILPNLFSGGAHTISNRMLPMPFLIHTLFRDKRKRRPNCDLFIFMVKGKQAKHGRTRVRSISIVIGKSENKKPTGETCYCQAFLCIKKSQQGADQIIWMRN